MHPLRHIDPYGSVFLPLLLIVFGQQPFGWGRPPRVVVKNLRRPYWNMLMVSAAGPAVNMVLAVAALIAVGIATATLGDPARKAAFAVLFNQIDGGTERWGGFPLIFTLVRLATLNAFLAVFNLLPVPPLDGGQIALQLLPIDWAAKLARVRPYGLIIGIALAMLGVVPLLILPFCGILGVVISSL